MNFSKPSIPFRRNHHKTSSLLSLLKSGFTPTIHDFNNFLFFLSQTQRFQCIINLSLQMKSNQIKMDSGTLTFFAKALIKEQKYEDALHFLGTHMGKTKVLHQNRIFDSLIQGFCRNKNDPEKGISVLRDCLGIDGVVPSSFTFCSLIYAFSARGKMDRVIEVLELMTREKFNYPFDNFVCSSVICGFLRIGKPELAVGFYENAVKSDALKPNVVTYTTLLNAYFLLGRIEEVSDIVSRMDEDGLSFDVVFYSNLIFCYFREGMMEEAFRKNREMIDRKLEMDTIAYTILMDGMSKEGNVEKAVGFVRNMVNHGIRPNLVTFTALMLGLSKKGKLEEAFALFKMVEDFDFKMDEFIYSVLIDGVCRRADFDCAFRLLDEMETKGIKASVVTYNIIINGLCKARRTTDAGNISNSIVGDVVTYATLLHGFVDEGNTEGILNTKERFEAAGICMDVVMCNVLIKALFMVGLFEDAIAIYKGMPEMGLAATSVTYCTMVCGYCKAGRIDQALEIFNEFLRTSNFTATCCDAIIDGLCQKGLVDMAVEVFIELIERSLTLDRMLYMRLFNQTFNANGAEGVYLLVHRMKGIRGDLIEILGNYAILFLCKKGSTNMLIDILLLMMANRLTLSSEAYYLILKSLMRDGKTLLIRIILTMFLKQYGMADHRVNKIIVDYMCMKDVNNALKFVKRLNENSFSITFSVTVLQTLTKYGRVLDSYELILGAKDHLPDIDLLAYSSIISGLCKEGHLDKALELCGFARKKGISLSIATYNEVINGLLHQGCLVQALRLFESLEKINLFPSETTYATLVHSLSKEGLLVDARRVFASMSHKNMKPNIRVYNSLINGYCKLGQIEKALEMFLDLEAEHLKPDEFTVSAVIYGYCQKGDTEGAIGFFSEFMSKNISPDFLGFIYLIRGLIAKGRMEESQSILREMLRSQSIIDILSRIDTGVEIESLHNFLVILCEKGSIQEAVSILDEVGSIFFPVKRRPSGNDTCAEHKPCDVNLTENIISDSLVCTSETCKPRKCNNEESQGSSTTMCQKISKSLDIDSSYKLVASLCSEGEISKANKLVKIISGFF